MDKLDTQRRSSGFSGANAEYIDQLYEAFRSNPDNVAPEWRSFFFGFEHGAEAARPGLATPSLPAALEIGAGPSSAIERP